MLVFALITTSVGATYVWGMYGLTDAREFERTNNAQRAMEALADNVDDLVRGGAPSRATEIELADARLGTGDPVTVNVSTRDANYSYSVTPIVYDAGGERIRYVNGAVIRAGNGGATMVREPAFVNGTNRVLVPIVKTYARESGVGGSATVLVRTERVSTEETIHAAANTDVTVTVSAPNERVWRRYFEEELGWSCEPDGASCSRSDAAVTVQYTQVRVAFE